VKGNARARWKLGKALAEVERDKPFPGSATVSAGLTRFRDFLKQIKLDRQVAVEAQRIGTLPDAELAQALGRASLRLWIRDREAHRDRPRRCRAEDRGSGRVRAVVEGDGAASWRRSEV
jgi:hypothetical protein